MHKHNTMALWSWDLGQDTTYILRALLERTRTLRNTASQPSSHPEPGCWLLLSLLGETRRLKGVKERTRKE